MWNCEKEQWMVLIDECIEYKICKFIKSVGGNIKLWREREEISWLWKKGKGESSPFNIEAVGKNIKWGRGEGDGNFGEEKRDLNKMGAGKNIKL